MEIAIRSEVTERLIRRLPRESRSRALRVYLRSSIVPRQFALPQEQANSFSSFFVRRSAGTSL
jgi:hypothetical protein